RRNTPNVTMSRIGTTEISRLAIRAPMRSSHSFGALFTRRLIHHSPRSAPHSPHLSALARAVPSGDPTRPDQVSARTPIYPELFVMYMPQMIGLARYGVMLKPLTCFVCAQTTGE